MFYWSPADAETEAVSKICVRAHVLMIKAIEEELRSKSKTLKHSEFRLTAFWGSCGRSTPMHGQRAWRSLIRVPSALSLVLISNINYPTYPSRCSTSNDGPPCSSDFELLNINGLSLSKASRPFASIVITSCPLSRTNVFVMCRERNTSSRKKGDRPASSRRKKPRYCLKTQIARYLVGGTIVFRVR